MAANPGAFLGLLARLPGDRQAEGTLEVFRGTARILGPMRCRGEADNAGAMRHGNVQEDPVRAYGDHPAGVYRVVLVARDPEPSDSYGPAFLRLDGLAGEALDALRNGRTGIGIHGGRLDAAGGLRATYGCLRVEDAVAAQLADLVEPELEARRPVVYRCEVD
jgi:hypothetical protein